MEPFLGEIRLFSGQRIPTNWARCDGALLTISGNEALFSLIGSTYGGNGVSNFALPNLMGRLPVGDGQGTGLTNRKIGISGGEDQHQLTTDEYPVHTHTVQASKLAATQSKPSDGTIFASIAAPDVFYDDLNKVTGGNANFSVNAVGVRGQSLPHENMMPCICISYMICISGFYPNLNT